MDDNTFELATEIARSLNRISLTISSSSEKTEYIQHQKRVLADDPVNQKELQEIVVQMTPVIEVARTLSRLDAILEKKKFSYRPVKLDDSEFWSIGKAKNYLPIRETWGGFIEPILTAAIPARTTDRVFAFLNQVGDEFLKKENHDNFGYHYHYCNWRRQRTQFILCWDTSFKSNTQKELRPLLHERHGEGRYNGIGHPNSWRNKKRKAMYDACAKDLDKLPISSFKPPSKIAEETWPLSS